MPFSCIKGDTISIQIAGLENCKNCLRGRSFTKGINLSHILIFVKNLKQLGNLWVFGLLSPLVRGYIKLPSHWRLG